MSKKLMAIVKKIADSYKFNGVVPINWIKQLGDEYYKGVYDESEKLKRPREKNIYDGRRVRHGVHADLRGAVLPRAVPASESAVGEQLELPLCEK